MDGLSFVLNRANGSVANRRKVENPDVFGERLSAPSGTSINPLTDGIRLQKGALCPASFTNAGNRALSNVASKRSYVA